MSHEQQLAGVSVRDLVSALEAVREDQGAVARIVLFVRQTKEGKAVLHAVVQACDASGVPVPDVSSHGFDWPTSSFRTLTQAFHWYVGCLYDTLEYARYRSARERRDGQ